MGRWFGGQKKMAFEKIKCFVRFPKKSFQSLGGLGGAHENYISTAE